MTLERFPAHSPDDGPPYSKGVRANGFVFVSGQVALDQHGRLVSGSIEIEARQCLDNLRAILRHYNLALSDVVKVMVWLTNTDDFNAFNTVYREYFGNALPARACVQAKLMGAFNVELDAIALDRQNERN